MKRANALFLHSGWRSASTWLWSCFREEQAVMGFCEPLHELLSTLRRSEVPGVRPDSWDSGHSDLSRPYFDEFLPLFARLRPGVRKYRVEFAVNSYFAQPGDEHPELAAYMQSILDLAHARKKLPVLKLCRSMARSGWMRAAFPDATHVAVLRNPWTQFMSAWRLLEQHDNAYFVTMPFIILAENSDVPRVSAAIDAFDVQRVTPVGRTFLERFDACKAQLQGASLETCYRAFLALWMLSSTTAIPSTDLCIDMDRLATSPDYRYAIQDDLAERTGVHVNFETVRTPARRQSASVDPSALRERAAIAARCHERARLFMSADLRIQSVSGVETMTLVQTKIDEAFAAASAQQHESDRPHVLSEKRTSIG